jgi:hypothetical protein
MKDKLTQTPTKALTLPESLRLRALLIPAVCVTSEATGSPDYERYAAWLDLVWSAYETEDRVLCGHLRKRGLL